MVKTYSRKSIRWAVFAALFASASGALADAVTDRAASLLEQGKAREAFEILAPLESERSGSVEFDLLLGIAAVDAQQPTRAVFALERVLAMEPNNPRARAEIARAYLALGETDTARREFETVKGQAVPPVVKAAIDRYLTALDRIDDEGKTRARAFFEMGFGHDTNVNAGPAIDQYQGFTIPTTQQKMSDNFTTFAGGADFRMPLGKGLSLVGGLAASLRANMNRDQFDSSSIDGNIGVAHQNGKNVLSATLQGSSFSLAIDPTNNGIARTSERYRDSAGFGLQWQHNYDQRTQSSAFVQYSELTYPGQRFRDASKWLGGLGFAKAFRDSPVLAFGGVYFGDETADNPNRNDLGFRMLGLRVGGQYTLREDLGLFGNLGFEHRRHHQDDPIALSRRRDDQTTVGLGLAWTPARDWRVTPQVQYMRNKSNIVINDFTRSVYSVTLRRDF